MISGNRLGSNSVRIESRIAMVQRRLPHQRDEAAENGQHQTYTRLFLGYLLQLECLVPGFGIPLPLRLALIGVNTFYPYRNKGA
jgi:hypothetical protein